MNSLRNWEYKSQIWKLNYLLGNYCINRVQKSNEVSMFNALSLFETSFSFSNFHLLNLLLTVLLAFLQLKSSFSFHLIARGRKGLSLCQNYLPDKSSHLWSQTTLARVGRFLPLPTLRQVFDEQIPRTIPTWIFTCGFSIKMRLLLAVSLTTMRQNSIRSFPRT